MKTNDFELHIIFFCRIMSPPMKRGDILFLAPLSVRPSVRPSVCPTHFRVRSISYEQVKYDETMCSAYV